ncbi:methyl-accepting chemotaxis protein [Shewanella sp. NFH-SH190041]|uniref:methyl-accepting chemotaxis protein n=1 Tax=Shewanella sp. NFH-SH190041 TaxID=2950245 RepID=UPI0021FFC45A|nr:PAS domain-containing methyl-accepting chemotaxis protein [Shewanella sp. NFH-SH190041]BDM63492.1 methyl-accepting chemotaxis protein [Shewanella sp. NFH-SH190041]
MFNFNSKHQQSVDESLLQSESIIHSIKESVATIEFMPDGTILDANSLFLGAVGYSLEEVKGKHHRMFCPPEVINSAQYRTFWSELAQGKAFSGVFLRKNKAGDEMWLQATYFPIKVKGVVTKVMKIAADITEQKHHSDSQAAIFTALDRSQAIIEFTPEGIILNANVNFLNTVGYTKEQIVGKHHKIFCDEQFYIDNPTFWAELASGQPKSGMFQRRGATGQIIWLEATYNPIQSESGKIVKVIKFASDITDRVMQDIAVREAADVAYSTSEETAKIAMQGAGLLHSSVETSNIIAEQVNKTTESINLLNEQSKSIEAIVSTISSIAEQTNLLALNAAIEAARAGDQGRGFAVVADEVRQLAARTSQSTDEIATVVAENRNLTTGATAMMNEVAQTAENGKQQIAEVTTVMDEIRKGAENVSSTVSGLSSTG